MTSEELHRQSMDNAQTLRFTETTNGERSTL